jgi:hypothetical protein
MKCIEEHCNKQSLFNLPNEKRGIYCREHSNKNMIDVISKRCLEEKCDKQPNFNFLNENLGIYCNKHKKAGMIDVLSKRCLENNCNKQPIFNFFNEKIGIYCKEHKKNNMFDVKSKKCQQDNCNKRPLFNLPNETIGIYCKEHSKKNMIDVSHKRCQENECNKRPNFNLPNEKIGIYCKEHSKENMINVIDKRCLEEYCNKIPSFNLPNKKNGVFCNKHKKVDMIDVTHKRCLEDNCDIILTNKKYKGYCLRCFIHKFPDVKISKNYKVKELFMTDFIKEQFKDEMMIFDKIVGGCSKRRPDVYVDKFTHVLIIECDENQHRDTSCENKRTMELFQDFGNRPIVFIRFNPDSYINEIGKKVLSSFKMHKGLDVPIIREQKEWLNRLNILKETIEHWLNIIPNKEVTNEYLFYDCN